MRKSVKSVRYLTFAALLVALDIIFTRLIPPIDLQILRVSFQFIPQSLAGAIFGPFAAICTATGDFLGIVLFPKGLSINPFITGVMALKGLMYGFFFYKRRLNILQIALVFAIVVIVCDIVAMSLVLHFMFNLKFWYILSLRAITGGIMLPVYTVTFWFLWGRMRKTGLF